MVTRRFPLAPIDYKHARWRHLADNATDAQHVRNYALRAFDVIIDSLGCANCREEES